ncbi:hypothetical protein RSAG8_03978, partial [Rhizoctonia solani AG-8 WAC10335]
TVSQLVSSQTVHVIKVGFQAATGVTNQSTETTQSIKTSGSNFSMCEIIM